MKSILQWSISGVCVICLALFYYLQPAHSLNAAWVIMATVLLFYFAYRTYCRFIAVRVLSLNAKRLTPAVRLNDGIDYVPTNRVVVFGHHFAAIAGAGPLIGPVLAVQLGYAPGLMWILAGAIFAGAVQDFIILTFSMRHDGRSLGSLISIEMGRLCGIIAQFAIFLIMIILLAVLALIVVKALTHSPWSVFTVAATIPIAIFMGLYSYYVRPNKVGEVSAVGLILLLVSIAGGKYIAGSAALAPYFDLSAKALVGWICGYGVLAALLPVWLLLAPRDYLSTFLKLGTMLLLSFAILLIGPELKMPALTQFVNGQGPVWAGKIFPFLFITIACGAVSGFHSLIASGTTPKLIIQETDAAFIGYGGMLMESCVAMVALICASCLEPGVYFALNSPAAFIGTTLTQASQTITSWGYYLTPEMLSNTAATIGEHTILSRTGGAPTLAIGIAQILSNLFSKSTLAFWYHFAILFESIFILTALDAGTRVGRFLLQDFFDQLTYSTSPTKSWKSNILATFLCVGLWGYFLYQGVMDPFGGVNTLWPLFGMANQMLAAIALIYATLVLVRKGKLKYLLVTLLPALWLLLCTLAAAVEKIFSADTRIGFLAHARSLKDYIATNPQQALLSQIEQLIFNDYIDAGLTAFFAIIVIGLTVLAVIRAVKILQGKQLPPNFRQTKIRTIENTRCC
jgi:carbon starvation protein CstA